MNLGLEAPVQLPFLIVHLTQDHVVLQEKFVSHTESGTQKESTHLSMNRIFFFIFFFERGDFITEEKETKV